MSEPRCLFAMDLLWIILNSIKVLTKLLKSHTVPSSNTEATESVQQRVDTTATSGL